VSIFSNTSLQPHRRLYILNLQLAHLNQQSLFQLGKWYAKKRTALDNKKADASTCLAANSVSQLGLRSQWQMQVANVTQKAPSMVLFLTFLLSILTKVPW
jgi:hypothetical protein